MPVTKHAGLDKVPRGRFVFAFVRHPLEWYRSYWAYKMTVGWDKMNKSDNACKSKYFDEFITNIIDKNPGRYTSVCREFCGHPDNPIDFTGRVENMEEDLRHALKLAGEEIVRDVIGDTPPVNKSKKNFKDDAVYASWQRDAIYDLDREAFERFGYNPKS